jgi:hypothetical protein
LAFELDPAHAEVTRHWLARIATTGALADAG